MSEVDRIFLMAAGTWDGNHDGEVACAEWQGYLVDLFASADKSHDGALSAEEFTAFAQTDRLFSVATFEYWDANHDANVTRSELVDRQNPAFTHLDRDANCVLTETELSAARSLQSVPRGGPPGKGPGREGAPGGPPGGGNDNSGSGWPG